MKIDNSFNTINFLIIILFKEGFKIETKVCS